jgi:uncharacterized hydrophobic protein (TIGR00271 family)
MSKAEEAKLQELSENGGFRDWFAYHLGVRTERKEEIYISLSQSASVRDASYWLQILFAAGIATLGLVLNSPAVIIGAMLISPLMGPILAGGLALAAGDIMLGIRAIVNLLLSCLVAVTFAVLLVGLLPFKEMTGEIAGRTQPTTLDLIVALFSGAIGSLATCKEVKGVVTSIPGVAIAVALMPPLCVVGYGVGLAFSLNAVEGMRVARGGGLLFLTNLVAITFTAMIVFLLLYIDTTRVRQRVEEWRKQDKETAWFRSIFGRIPISERVRAIGRLPGRFLMIFIPILIILFPLSESFSQLRSEIARQQRDNRFRQAALELWDQNFGTLTGGQPRSYIDRLSVAEQDGRLIFNLRVFTSNPYSNEEKIEYSRLVAARLDKPVEIIGLQLVEIPTTSSELAAKSTEQKRIEAPVEAPPTVAELQARFLEGVDSAIKSLQPPPPARLVTYKVMTSAAEPLNLMLSYLSDRDIEADAQFLIASDIRARLGHRDATVSFERIPATPGQIIFARNQAIITDGGLLDLAGQVLRQQPGLTLEIIANQEAGEREGIRSARAQALADYMNSKWQIAPGRMTMTSGEDTARTAILKFNLAGAN